MSGHTKSCMNWKHTWIYPIGGPDVPEEIHINFREKKYHWSKVKGRGRWRDVVLKFSKLKRSIRFELSLKILKKNEGMEGFFFK